MTRQIINTGTAANDGSGDPLRTAFDKINANFTELYREFGSSNVNISNNNITTINASENLLLTPNGSGQVVVGSLNNVRINSVTDSSSGTTGALVVAGGIGAGGSIFSNELINAPIGVFGAIHSTGPTSLMDDTNLTGALYIKPLNNVGVPLAGPAIIPGLSDDNPADVNLIYDIGTADRYFRNLYVANVYATTLMYDGGGFDFLDNTPIGPNVASYANFTTVNVQGDLIAQQNLQLTGQLTTSSDIVPDTANSHDVGALTAPFNNMYANNFVGNTLDVATIVTGGTILSGDDLSTTGQLFVRWSNGGGSIQAGSAILPGLHDDADGDVNNQYDIGSDARRFRRIYATTWANDLQVQGNVSFTGSLVGDLTGVASSAVTAGSATYAITAGSAISASTSQTVTENAQPGITSIGTLTNLTVDGAANFNSTANFQGNVSVTGTLGLGSPLKALYGIVTDSADAGTVSSSYQISLNETATSVVKMDITGNITLSWNTSNITAGNKITVIIRNSGVSNCVVTLPNNRNTRGSATVSVGPSYTSFFEFYTVGITSNDVYVNIAGAV